MSKNKIKINKMGTYRFSIRKHIRDDMYSNEFVEVELTDSEYRSIKSDDSKYSKGSSLVSSKLGETVQVQGFPNEIKVSKGKEKKEGKSKSSKKSLWKPIWAIPFKLIWRLFKLFLPFK